VAEKPHDAVIKFDTYRNLQRRRAVLPATARHLVYFSSHGLSFLALFIVQNCLHALLDSLLDFSYSVII